MVVTAWLLPTGGLFSPTPASETIAGPALLWRVTVPVKGIAEVGAKLALKVVVALGASERLVAVVLRLKALPLKVMEEMVS